MRAPSAASADVIVGGSDPL